MFRWWRRMTNQNQVAGNNATNIQAGGAVTIHQGVTYSDARQISIDVFKENFLQLAGEAADVARRRAEEITEDFLLKLQNQNTDGLSQAKEPDFQHALFTVQKEYARCGDKELGDLLVDLLVDRTKQPSRSILQIVLNESLSVAPKLTPDQLAALSVVFYFRYTINKSTNNHNLLFEELDRYVRPFAGSLEKKQACYQHLEYSGCGAIGIGTIILTDVFLKQYPGLFSRGFDEVQFQSKALTIPLTHPLFRPCLNDPAKWQINAMNEETIKVEAAKHNIGNDLAKVIALHNEALMPPDDVQKILISGRPYMEKVFDVWKDTMSHFTLTSVGIAIGHANIKKVAGEFTDLSTWIN